jgi:hypothetical protein
MLKINKLCSLKHLFNWKIGRVVECGGLEYSKKSSAPEETLEVEPT